LDRPSLIRLQLLVAHLAQHHYRIPEFVDLQLAEQTKGVNEIFDVDGISELKPENLEDKYL
jgi:hypothetical protein